MPIMAIIKAIIMAIMAMLMAIMAMIMAIPGTKNGHLWQYLWQS